MSAYLGAAAVSVRQGTRVRLDHRGTGTVLRLLQISGADSCYANVAWDNGGESWEWVHSLLLISQDAAR